jgi:hypothetical protein
MVTEFMGRFPAALSQSDCIHSTLHKNVLGNKILDTQNPDYHPVTSHTIFPMKQWPRIHCAKPKVNTFPFLTI